MAAEMKGTSKELDKMARYTALKKEVEANVELYNSLYAQDQRSRNLRGLEVGRHPGRRSGPGSRDAEEPAPGSEPGGGAAGGIDRRHGLAFICEELDNKLRSPEDIRRWIGSANVSIIPVIGEAERQEAGVAWPKRIVGYLPSLYSDERRPIAFSWRGQIRLKVKRCRRCMPPSCFRGLTIRRKPC